MDDKLIYIFCKKLGCCDICCFRYMGYKKPSVYTEAKKYADKYEDEKTLSSEDSSKCTNNLDVKNDLDSKLERENSQNNLRENDSIKDEVNDSKDNKMDIETNQIGNKEITEQVDSKLEDSNLSVKNLNHNNDSERDSNEMSPPCKKRRVNVCVSCLGVLQEDYWDETICSIKEALEKKRYECETYTCGLSAPICTLLRERMIALKIGAAYPDYNSNLITPLKDAWKMSFREQVASKIDKRFDGVSPLFITVHLDYPDDLQELEILKSVSPVLFTSRSKQKKRFPTEFTRQSVEQALHGATLEALESSGANLTASSHAHCVSVACAHTPAYLGGRYIKLSRNLPQSPWVLDGQRVVPTSVQEIIFGPLAKHFQFSETEVESRLKFIAAGREDVDVRCLGDGRPFAIEISDPTRLLKTEELERTCELINESGDVVVKALSYITKDDLVQLKKGEETKCKTYEALCVKLTHSKFDEGRESPIPVIQKELDYINSYRNTEPTDPARINIAQKTPIRVLHRRPLLTRSRQILDLTATPVPEHPNLFLLNIITSAGTYVKEWIHGEFSRSKPSLSYMLEADIDLVALDVTQVHLEWPPTN